MQLSIPYVITGPDGTRVVFGNSDAAKADLDYAGWLDSENPPTIVREIRESAEVVSDLDGYRHGTYLKGRASIALQGSIDPNVHSTPAAVNAIEDKIRRAVLGALPADALFRYTPDGSAERAWYCRAAQDPAFGGRRPKTYGIQLVSARPYALSPVEQAIWVPATVRANHFPNPSSEAASAPSAGADWALLRQAGSAAIPAKFGAWRDRLTYDGAYSGDAIAWYPITFPGAGTWAVTLNVWIPANYSGTGVLRLVSNSFAGASAEVWNVQADMTKRDQWQRIQSTLTVAGGDLAGFFVLRHADAAGGAPASGATGVIYVDAVQDDLGAPTPFYDGTGPGVVSPVASPLSAPFNEVGAAYVVNAGELATWPRFRIDGPIKNPQLLNRTTGRILRLNYTLGAGEWLDVFADPLAPAAIRLGGTFDRYGALDRASRLWQLVPGENDVRLSATTWTAPGGVTVFHRSAWP